MHEKTKTLIILAILVILLIAVIVLITKNKIEEKMETKLQISNGITVVPTMRDTITSDSSWCGTFQLIWNDLKNEVAGQNIIFQEQMEMVDNLNLEEFNKNMISDEYYYNNYGLKTIALKEEIEKGIYEKFGQTSDILNQFDWSEESLHSSGQHDYRYFLYVMLYRKFEFLQTFDKLNSGKFGDEYNNIEYFGIDENTKDSVGNQIDVLYYNSRDDFAISINTKTSDEVIFCKNPEGTSFNEIYENMNKQATNYKGSQVFNDVDEFKAPYLKLDITEEYTELAGKEFQTSVNGAVNGEPGIIQQAIQSIKFTLDENGGEIKSEAGVDVTFDSAVMEEPKKDTPRYFYVDDTFTIFLKERNQNMPYFAGRIDNITKFQ